MYCLLWVSLLVISVSGFDIRRRNDDDDHCPPEQQIYPCYCLHDYQYSYTSVNCQGLRNIDTLKDVLKATKGYNVSLALYKGVLDEIPSDLFQGQIFHELYFEHCRIHSFGDKPFSGLEDTLLKIYIYGCVDKRRNDLKTLPLGHLKKLHTFQFMANDIKRVGNEWFQGGPQTLEQISLEANDIEELGDQAFASLVNLQQIWLGDNNFKVISRSMFPKTAPALQLLEMSFNGIEVLPDDMFSDMPKLNRVTVSGNKLKSLPQNIWGNVWNQLEEVYVDRTQLVCDQNIKWIFERKLPKIFDGRCYGDNALTGKRLEKLTMQDFQ